MNTNNTGGCHCGKVTFTVSGPLREVVYCHCEQCRKQTGLYVGATRTSNAELNIEGAENLTWYAASDQAERGFCSTCGSLLFWRAHGSANTSIMAGAFEKPTGLKSGFHIYVADKGDYYDICDGLPQFEQAD